MWVKAKLECCSADAALRPDYLGCDVVKALVAPLRRKLLRELFGNPPRAAADVQDLHVGSEVAQALEQLVLGYGVRVSDVAADEPDESVRW